MENGKVIANFPFSIFNSQLLFRRRNCHFHDIISSFLEQIIRRFNLIQRENMCDERCSIQFAALDQPQDFCGVAAVHAAGLEREVFAVHIGQRQRLRLVIQRNDSDDRIRSGALPREA